MKPSYINIRPMGRDIPWPWRRGLQSTLTIPSLSPYYDWTTWIMEDVEPGSTSLVYGTRNHKSIFSTAVRLVGLERLLGDLPPLDPIVEGYLDFNQKLLVRSPVEIDRFIIGDAFADEQGPFVSQDVFHLWLAPAYKRLIALAHQYDALPYLYFGGDISNLLDEVVGLGASSLIYEPIGGMADLHGKEYLDNVNLWEVGL